MSDRTFKQYLAAFGASDFEIIAKINGTMVYEGPVTSTQELAPAPSELLDGQFVFSWTLPLDFAGQIDFEILVVDGPDNGRVIMTDTLANHNYVHYDDGRLSRPTGPDVFIPFYRVPGPAGIMTDPFEQVIIDGVEQNPARDDSRLGYWGWRIATGQLLTAKMNVTAGGEIKLWDSNTEYSWDGGNEQGTGDDILWVHDGNGNEYVLSALVAPAGTPLTDTEVWKRAN